MTTDKEVSRPCVCSGSCPCCSIGEVIDHCCPNCATEFCPNCHGIAKAVWTRAYDNVSKCHCKPEANPLEKPVTTKPKTRTEDVSIYLDVEGRQPAAFKDPTLVRGFILRLARRQEDLVNVFREFNRRLTQAEKAVIGLSDQLRELKNVYVISEDEDIEDLLGDKDG